MTKDKRVKVKVESEMRTEEISDMIDEGGLGAEKYYKIKKDPTSTQTNTEEDKE
ncbi:hypothetical protein [Sporosarcina sp. FA9]|uniref:hypothetical protein n=1 Tax=Sporosarcina sp. FA9 TaxID=3413030 RepID=UPI003F659060